MQERCRTEAAKAEKALKTLAFQQGELKELKELKEKVGKAESDLKDEREVNRLNNESHKKTATTIEKQHRTITDLKKAAERFDQLQSRSQK